MKRLNYLIGLSILAALILAMVAIVPASADKPPVDRAHLVLDDIDPVCGVDMPFHFEGDLKYTFLCDEKDKVCGDSYIFTNVTYTITYNGNTITSHGSMRERYTWITEEETLIKYSGGWFIDTIPGHGVVFGTVGRQVYLETCPPEGEQGECESEILHWPGMVFDDQEAVCDYLLYGN